jgi:hypothetical protein
MPLLDDILDNKVLGREFKRGLAEGETMGALTILRLLMVKRFGSIPDWAEQRIGVLWSEEVVDLGVRLLDATGLEDLLPFRGPRTCGGALASDPEPAKLVRSLPESRPGLRWPG